MEETEKKSGRRKQLIAAIAAVVVVAIGAVVFWPAEREPEYKGKKLSEWAVVCVKAERAYSEATFGCTYYEVKTNRELQALRAEGEAARDVVVRLGTNSIPWLIKQIEYQTPGWRWRVFFVLDRIPGVRGYAPMARVVVGEVPIVRQNRARLVFAVLGRQAGGAAPALEKILSDPKMSGNAKLFASRCLGDVTGQR